MVGGSPGAKDSSEPLRCQITMFLGREAKRPRCASASTSVHSETSGHLFVFVYVRGVHACACVSPASHVSALVFVCMYPGPLSESVAVGLCLSGWQCLVLCVEVYLCLWVTVCP